MTCFYNKLGEFLREKNISQLELYKMTGITPGSISNIVNGKQIPYPGWKRKISNALGVKEAELFPEVG